MPGKEPIPKAGMCEHGRVRTLCGTCRQALAVAPAIRAGAPRPRDRQFGREQPEARVSCATCQARGTARGFVEDADAKQFLCRTHAAERSFPFVTYTTSGKIVQAAAPSAAHWKDVLRDSRATSIRGSRGPPGPV